MTIRYLRVRPNLGSGFVRLAVVSAFATGLSGCGSKTAESMNPVNWWHDLEGGAIAKQRPSPPGANDPYPNLASVPERPARTDPSLRTGIADALVADRTNAQRVAAAAPLPDPSSPAASPNLFGVGTTPPPSASAPPSDAAPPSASASPALSASLPGAQAAPHPPEPAADRPAPAPSRAPVGTVKESALPPPTIPADQLPGIPAAPPAPAALSGVPAPPAPPPSASPQVAAAVPPTAAPARTPAAAAPPVAAAATTRPATAGNAPVAVAFAPGSATLPPGSADVLRGIAARRGSAAIAVTGYGDAASADPSAQAAAVSLGLSRAQAIAAALASDGVPATAMRLDAEAAGQGGTVRLLN